MQGAARSEQCSTTINHLSNATTYMYIKKDPKRVQPCHVSASNHCQSIRYRRKKTRQRPPHIPLLVSTQQQTVLPIIHIQRQLRVEARVPRLLEHLVDLALREREEREAEIRHSSGRVARMHHLAHVLGLPRHPGVAVAVACVRRQWRRRRQRRRWERG
jgi:hypothetical protein